MIMSKYISMSRFIVALWIAACCWPVAGLSQDFVQPFQTQQAEQRLGNQLVALIGFTALPGLSGSRFNVDSGANGPQFRIDKLAASSGRDLWQLAEGVRFRLEGGLGYLYADEKSFALVDLPENAAAVKTDREVYSGQIGAGLSVSLSEHFTLRPTLHVALSHFSNETGLGLLPDIDGDVDPDDLFIFDWSLWAASVAASLRAIYDQDVGAGNIRAELAFAQAYTEIIDAPSDGLRLSGSHGAAKLTGKWRQPTGLTLFDRPLYWDVFASATRLTGGGRAALGFDEFVTIGAGLLLDIRRDNIPLSDALRVQIAAIKGDNVEGGQISFGLRF